MAVYKVPQDVEAEDKLLGPFSFRQFIYLIIVAMSGAAAWGLAQLFIPLAILPLPIILFFGALALPLRKDQPMETYLAAIVSFYLKPRKRMWEPDGVQTLIKITAPKRIEVQRTKSFDQEEAALRLSYLANIVDTRGWATRGISGPTPQPDSAMTTDAYYAAQQAEDVLDEDGRTAQNIDSQLDAAATRQHQELVKRMQQPGAPTPPASQEPPATPDPNLPHLSVNPYPSMHQSVVRPMDDQAAAPSQAAVQPPQNTAAATSANQPSPDIINLANNSDLSVETIAHEAKRIQEKAALPDDEVMISLR